MRAPLLQGGWLLLLSIFLLIFIVDADTHQKSDNDFVFEADSPNYSADMFSATNDIKHNNGILARVKRQFGLFDLFSPFSSTTESPSPIRSVPYENEVETNDNQEQQQELDGEEEDYDDDIIDGQDVDETWKNSTPEHLENEGRNGDNENDDVDYGPNYGSGDTSYPSVISPGKEMTIRVSFIVQEPYKHEYSNRDSQPFQELSKALAEAVNSLYERMPGDQKATLVRIQSRPADEVTCKVTLDLQTVNFYDTDQLQQVLRRHIRDTRRLGSYAVSDDEFSFKKFDEVLDERLKCLETEIPCQSGSCIEGNLRCDGIPDCPDGSDEFGCGVQTEVSTSHPRPLEENTELPKSGETERYLTEPTETQRPPSLVCRGDDQVRCSNSDIYICEDQRCDGIVDCPDNDDEQNCPSKEEEDKTECPEQEMVCDVSRCVPLSKRCDRIADCQDGSDERNCPQICQPTDFRCNDGRCIDDFRKCDRVTDCINGEDEIGCPCQPDEFTCGDGTCIELRRRCDGQSNCNDLSDEMNCTGIPDSKPDKPEKKFKCEDGILIDIALVCNGRYDCGPGDISDEYSCPYCKKGDFVCKNGACIFAHLRCDGTTHCMDGSDEENCVPCQSDQFTCNDRKCILIQLKCDGHVDCAGGEDESYALCSKTKCPYDKFQCQIDNKCIDKKLVCDNVTDCTHGDDEENCIRRIWADPSIGRPICQHDEFTCNNGDCIRLADTCNDHPDCLDGSDEQDCPDGTDDQCEYECSDGSCIYKQDVCNGYKDCPDGGDEQDCDGSQQECGFRCGDGACIEKDEMCDGIPDCSDGSDESYCVSTTSPPETCAENEFRCGNGECIQSKFRCDGFEDCNDNSDEKNCKTDTECPVDGIVCDGKCVYPEQKCDGVKNCNDGSDEENCGTCSGDQYACPDGACIPFNRVCNRVADCSDGSDERECPCSENEFQCDSGQCIPGNFRCDSYGDCIDSSDEKNCQEECSSSEWRCQSGECVAHIALCDGTRDCRDGSDEYRCPPLQTTTPFYDNSFYTTERQTTQQPFYTVRPLHTTTTHRPRFPVSEISSLDIRVYPENQIIRQNGDVVFQCRDEGPLRAKVQWTREGNRPLPAGSVDVNGRLEIPRIQLADSGTYICQAVGYTNYPGNEKISILEVEPYATEQSPLPINVCREYEATCSNGDCIPKSAICDGFYNCSDASDESSCPTHSGGLCEPNEFKCANRRCISKAWVCDSDDDCRDRSDEINCPASPPGALCRSTEFECSTGQQCVPKHFHCDGSNDCTDGSDEHGCSPVYISRPPVRQLRLQEHETMTITCVAVGVPTPIVSWRLNWGHIPNKCTTSSVNGVGTLTCPDVLENDQGAYSCEAINTKGFVFAVPDTILIVNSSRISNVCPTGYFNSEARYPSECISCFCFGASTTCKSADLFTYQLPTPLGQGGTRLVGVVQPDRDVFQITDEPISDIFDFRTTYNGATVNRIGPWSTKNIYPYIALSESYLGSHLTSYGGYIKYKIRPHNDYQQPPQYTPFPDILIKSGNNLLIHRVNKPLRPNRDNEISVRLFAGSWQKITQYGLQQATREDIMMSLAQVDGIYLRGEESGGSIDITDFKMDSARSDNTGQGSAAFVEECSCPVGYGGLSCQSCSQGYTRISSGRWLGQCVSEEPAICQPGYYGDLSKGIPCQQCPCPLTNPGNQFSRTCILDSDGSVTCNCPSGYEGRRCERCSTGYVGNPTIPGDSCRAYSPPASLCDMRGTEREENGVCHCKHYAEGAKCDRCVRETFHLSNDNSYGCSECFCMGITTSCTSSQLRRSVLSVKFQSRVSSSDVSLVDWPAAQNSERHFITTGLYSDTSTQELSFRHFDRQKPTTYYWALPASRFAGNKITAYGGFINYTIKHVPAPGGQSSKNNAPDVQLISSNDIILVHYQGATPNPDGYLTNTVQLMEQYWQKSDGDQAHRQDILMALADLESILVKATYTTSTQLASLVSASIEVGDERGSGPRALHVEQCRCPKGYIGTSCEDCAPGYTRSDEGIYLGFCKECDCNGLSNECHPETGECSNCQNNTMGASCEECKPGYEFDHNRHCIEAINSSSIQKCRCDPRGTLQPICQSPDLRCDCKVNVVGTTCNQCAPGTFKLSELNPAGCSQCFCSGVTDQCHEASHLYRQQIPTAIIGDNHGFKLSSVDMKTVIEKGFILNIPLNQIGYVYNRYERDTLYWSLPQAFTGDRVTSYGGNLTVTQKYETDNDYPLDDHDVILVGSDLTIFWTNPQKLHPGIENVLSIPLQESVDWRTLEYGTASHIVSRSDFMRVLSNLRNVLVRATLAQDTRASYIADVAMDTALSTNGAGQPIAENIEVCFCPIGYEGTSCERCLSGYYRDTYGRCLECPCNNRASSCSLGQDGNVQCDCIPPYYGTDCSSENVGTIVTTGGPPLEPPSILVTVSAPTIQIKEVGSTVRFKCAARSRYSNAPITVTWSKERGTLPPTRTIVESSTGELIIRDVKVSDSGTYLCHASDGYSSATDLATLTVPGNERSEPRATINATIIEVYEGDPFELHCRATGNPAPSITWVRSNRRTLNPSHTTYDGIYRVEKSALSDEGEYRCIASNPNGRDEKLAVVYVSGRQPGTPVKHLTINPPVADLQEGESVIINCVSDHSGPSLPRITWTRDGGHLPANFRSNNGQLRISTIRPENAGVYRCSADNIDGPIISATITIKVDRQEQPISPPGSPPTVTVDVNEATVPEGENFTVLCRPLGDPLPIIKWTKIGSDFGPGVIQRGNALVINNARLTDRGMYVCVGTAADGRNVQAATAIQIEHREKPTIEIWPYDPQQVSIGGEARLQCRITAGAPEPDITWSRPSERPLSANTHLEPGGVLSLTDISVNDGGVYTCTASNIVGKSSASATIEVFSPPVIIIRPTTYLSVKPGESANFDCRVTGYPEPTAYWTMVSPEERIITTKSVGASVLSLQRVGERDEGTYACIAQNSAGTYEEKVHITVDDNSLPSRGDTPGIDDGGSPDYNPTSASNEYTAIEGENGVLRCEIPNQTGELNVSWVRSEGKPLSRTSQSRDFALYFTNITVNDAGIYECRVRDTRTNSVVYTVSIPLSVVRPPRIVLRPPTQTVRPGDTANLHCDATGDEPLTIQWAPQRGTFPDRVEVRGGSIVFHGIELRDAGLYVCTAVNRAGDARAVAEVIVNANVSMTQVVKGKQQSTSSGSNVELVCMSGGNGTEVAWSRQGAPLPNRVRSLPGGVLFLQRVQKADEGRYICLTRSIDGRTNQDYVDLKITGTDQNPLVILPPQRPVKEGDIVQVDCRSSGERLKVSWNALPPSRRYLDVKPYDNGAILYFDHVTPQDSGIYQCEGRDIYGTQFHDEFTLSVIPYSSISPSDAPPNENEVDDGFVDIVKSAPLGSSVDLSCDHNVGGPVRYQWTRPNGDIPSRVDTTAKKIHLVKLTEHDAGPYVCQITDGRIAMNRRIVLRITNVVPRFNGNSFIALEKLHDAYMSVDIEVAVKPQGYTGIILYNSEKEDPTGDFIALALIDGIPEYRYKLGAGTAVIRGDTPLELDQWHTIKLSRSKKDGFMYVDGKGPFRGSAEGTYQGLDLANDLYVGGVPTTNQLPEDYTPQTGFVGCIGRLTLGKLDISLLRDAKETSRLEECDSCTPNPCYNNAVCQDALTDRGYTCLCPNGFSGPECKWPGEACKPGLCGKGRCLDTDSGVQCSCPLGFIGKRCENQIEIENPAFDGGAYIAYSPPKPVRHLKMSLRIKPAEPNQDGIIFYCAESRHGHGDFTSLTVKDRHLEFRFDTGSGPAIIRSAQPVKANVWTNVSVSRIMNQGKMSLNGRDTVSGSAPGNKKMLILETPLYVGGYNYDWLTVNKGVGVHDGFVGCISDVEVHGAKLDIVNSPIQSSNVKECSSQQFSNPGGFTHRGDIPSEANGVLDDICAHCENGGYCQSQDSKSCICPSGYEGRRCEVQTLHGNANACNAQPCQNGGTCRVTRVGIYRCDCPLGTGGFNCQLRIELGEDVSLNGEGYVELPASLLPHDRSGETETIAFAFTTDQPDGLLLYQGEEGSAAKDGDFLLLQVVGGFVELHWELGGGVGEIKIGDITVSDGMRHQVIVSRKGAEASIEVDEAQEHGTAPGLSQIFNADSNIYIGGVPASLNPAGFVGFTGCIHQIEFQDSRAINLGKNAVAARNASPCTNSETNDVSYDRVNK